MCRSLVRFWDLKTALREAVTYLSRLEVLNPNATNDQQIIMMFGFYGGAFYLFVLGAQERPQGVLGE